MRPDHREKDGERSGRVFVLATIGAVVLIVAYFVAGMPGMDHSGGAMTGMEHQSPPELDALSPRMFELRVAEGEAFVVNVHVPTGESLGGTDETIAFDEILDSGQR